MFPYHRVLGVTNLTPSLYRKVKKMLELQEILYNCVLYGVQRCIEEGFKIAPRMGMLICIKPHEDNINNCAFDCMCWSKSVDLLQFIKQTAVKDERFRHTVYTLIDQMNKPDNHFHVVIVNDITNKIHCTHMKASAALENCHKHKENLIVVAKNWMN